MSLRRRFAPPEYEARSQGEQLRDLAQSAGRGVKLGLRVVDMTYTEPMWLGNLGAKPHAIFVGNVVDLQAQDQPVSCEARAAFVWEGERTGAKITKIDGLTPGRQYRFTFLVAQGSDR